MALVWFAAAAVLVGLASTRRSESAGTFAAALSLVTLLVCCLAMSADITTTTTVHASPSTPVSVQCGSGWASLHGTPYIETERGPAFNPANGSCEAAAWRRVAPVGTGELGLAVLIALGMSLASKRPTPPGVPERNHHGVAPARTPADPSTDSGR